MTKFKPSFEVSIPTHPSSRRAVRTFYRRDKALAFAGSIGAGFIFENGIDELGYHFSQSIDVDEVKEVQEVAL